jgi:outer membrane protein assembly factor BamE
MSVLSFSSFSLAHFLGPCLRMVLLGLACAGLAACTGVGGSARGFATAITPYKSEVVQGNFVSKEQVEALRVGMSRAQVVEVLGSPLLTSVFHADRWEYVFTIRRQGVDAQSRKLTVFFKGEDLEKFEGDPMPSEAEFVATIDTQRKFGKAPNLEATEEQLNKSNSNNAPASPDPALPSGTAPVSYPPLEPAR